MRVFIYSILAAYEIIETAGTSRASLLSEAEAESVERNEASEDPSKEAEGPTNDNRTGNKTNPLNSPKITVRQNTYK